MGRPCEYDEEKALDRAMLVFWQKGYGGTSISDLEAATGMKRQSLYNAFGDKSELYSRCIERYTMRFSELAAPLLRPDAGLAELRDSIESSFNITRENECGACMVVKTVFDQQVDDPEITKAASRAAQETRKIYERVLGQAQKRGEIEKSADPKSLASYLFTIASGLSALAQTGGSRAEIGRSLDLAFASLAKKPRTKPKRRPHAAS